MRHSRKPLPYWPNLAPSIPSSALSSLGRETTPIPACDSPPGSEEIATGTRSVGFSSHQTSPVDDCRSVPVPGDEIASVRTKGQANAPPTTLTSSSACRKTSAPEVAPSSGNADALSPAPCCPYRFVKYHDHRPKRESVRRSDPLGSAQSPNRR